MDYACVKISILGISARRVSVFDKMTNISLKKRYQKQNLDRDKLNEEQFCSYNGYGYWEYLFALL